MAVQTSEVENQRIGTGRKSSIPGPINFRPILLFFFGPSFSSDAFSFTLCYPLLRKYLVGSRDCVFHRQVK